MVPAHSMRPMTRVILDCDPGHDDALALMLALASPELEVLGVTTVAGNQTLAKTTANAIRVLDHLGVPGLPVHAGAQRPLVRSPAFAAQVHGETGLDGSGLPPAARAAGPAHAIDWIAATVADSPGPVTLVATGPLTNVALALARHPELGDGLERIVFMGGAIGEGNVTPAAEFNAWADPEAARRVLTSGVELTMVGLDVTLRALLGPAHIARLERAGAAGRLVAGLYGFSVAHNRARYGRDAVPVHDAVAVAEVIDPTLLTRRRCGVIVDTGSELGRGRTHVDRWGGMGWEPNCEVAVDIDADRFLELLVNRICALG
jgi:inosine-uridine nucleoside N-ribohydrolase